MTTLLELEPPPAPSARKPRVPPLENGDILDAKEFWRRYSAMKDLKKAELIEGVVYMGSPVSMEHGEPDHDLAIWLGNYRIRTLGLRSAMNSTVKLGRKNTPQPDIMLFVPESKGGKSKLVVKQDGKRKCNYLQGPPELVVEIATSSVSYDLHPKKRTYRRFGVQEYIVHRTFDGALDWFVLKDGKYELLAPDAEGITRSVRFPGLWLNVPALLAGRMVEVLATLEIGLQTPEHAAFVEKLKG